MGLSPVSRLERDLRRKTVAPGAEDSDMKSAKQRAVLPLKRSSGILSAYTLDLFSRDEYSILDCYGEVGGLGALICTHCEEKAYERSSLAGFGLP